MAVPSSVPSCWNRAMEGMNRGLLPVLLVNWDEDGESEIEWHLFSIEADGPAYDDSETLRERFVCGVAIAIRYHDEYHDEHGPDCREYDDS